ncbi:hypothetical protein CHS0354_027393 [Potamilus streckersoni]|uniref:Beta-ketoacyl synthase C-terminal domain-containing protein n=1 Tax=Potamilus streckersoni TaxID=2493646 RepID=A0AAE0SRA5_9BIVA|nr:hypothetical protein CHS0354_027393 [Potamilus streckersoni]
MNLAASSGNRHYRTLQEEAFDTENIPGHIKQQVIDGTLIRKIDNSLFDPARVPYTLPISPLSSDKSDTPDCYVLKASQREFLKDLPPGVEVTGRTESGDHILNFSGADSSTNQKEIHQIYTRLHKKLAVSSAGMLPAGLNLSKLYNSNHHPRGIQIALALETGANILGAVPEVYINADGYKPSISKPGIGNYISFAKAAGAVKGILGDASLKRHTAVYAHGTGTPQNRQTESAIISKTAQAFDADCWQVAAIKCFLGHPTGPAAGDQISTRWVSGADVTTERLQFNLAHQKINPADLHTILINSKGFGGNNATGVLVSPQKTMELLHRLHGKVACSAYEKKNQTIAARSQETSRASFQAN